MSYLITLPRRSFVHAGLLLPLLPFTRILPLVKRNSLELISHKFGIRTKSTKPPSYTTSCSPTCTLITRSQAPFPHYLFLFSLPFFLFYLSLFLFHSLPTNISTTYGLCFSHTFPDAQKILSGAATHQSFPIFCAEGDVGKWAKECGAAMQDQGDWPCCPHFAKGYREMGFGNEVRP